MAQSTLTERGQTSIPSALRKSMKLRPGQSFHWQRISDREIRFSVESAPAAGPLAALGYAKNIRPGPDRRTASWMTELRAGEQ